MCHCCRPKTVLVVTFLVALLCTAGITRQKTETNPDQLFTPTESQAVDDEDWIDSVFVSGSRRVNVFFVAEPGNPTNLVDDATVKDTIKAVIETRALTFSFVAPCSSGLPCTFRPISYSSVCVNATVRATGETACLAASVGDYFNNDVAEVDALTPLEVRQRLSDVNATDVFGRPLTRSSVMGGVEVDAAGVITSVEAFQLTGDVVFESVPIDGEPDGDPETISLEEYMYKELQDQDAAESRVRILPLTQAGQRESSGEAIGGDFNLFIAGYMLLFLYVLAVLFSRSWRHSRMTLAFAVLVSVMMVSCGGGVLGRPARRALVVTSVLLDNGFAGHWRQLRTCGRARREVQQRRHQSSRHYHGPRRGRRVCHHGQLRPSPRHPRPQAAHGCRAGQSRRQHLGHLLHRHDCVRGRDVDSAAGDSGVLHLRGGVHFRGLCVPGDGE